VNRLLRTNFDIMVDLGDSVLRPFLQDVVQFRGLALTLLEATWRDPLFVPQIFKHVGPVALVDWLGHFFMLGLYTVLHYAAGRAILDDKFVATEETQAPSLLAEEVTTTATKHEGKGEGDDGESALFIAAWLAGLSATERYTWRRRAEAWKYGAGLDY
jgi:hypothetical protein